ncbi:hypothetical protein [Rubellicoccus peritrichatus]|uniref:DUF4900 domain-containing protein n=1 Tax=Rubellicoccus peritrichatus TaxID=3080537 RepID=A0AAQ3QQ79_9BACT|nr:hypothetical protein [Puniceicoccus sp. CR14]WOO39953.1 hypothetical protein RZN69_15105 [Puniceicoccus sp. CR14]
MNTKQRKGNTILLVLIISTALGAAVFATLRSVRHESSMNKRAYIYHEARFAAETLLQSSFADLHKRMTDSAAFPVDELSPTRNPLSVPGEFVTKYQTNLSVPGGATASHNVVMPTKTKYTAMSEFGSEDTEVIGGPIPPGDWRFIDPNVPGNENDPLAGTLSFVRGIEILAKATVEKKNWGNTTAYTRQILEVRDAPLFAHAIFYNIPMEIAPGPEMHVYGNVHSNGDAFLQAGSGLYFHQKVTSADGIYHGRRGESGLSDSGGPVKMQNRDGDWVSMQEDSSWNTEAQSMFGGGWLESTDANWETLANQLWDGNVQNSDHDVMTQNPVGVLDYVEDTDTSTSVKDSENYSYTLIQPVLDKTQLALPDPTTDPIGYEEALRRNEIEKQKFSYKAGLTINVSSAGTVSLHTLKRDADGQVEYEADGTPKRTTIIPNTDFVTAESFASTGSGSSEVVNSGLYDKRRGKELDTIEIDVGKLTTLIHDNNGSDWVGGEKPETWWNGVVYVSYDQQAPSSTRVDDVNPAIDGWGVKITNAKEIPNPDFARAKGIYGTTFATNQTMYIDGHYNSDGDINTGSPVEPDSAADFAKQGEEASSALVADAITFLSTNWNDENSAQSKSNRVASNFTEVSAAILAGVVPSGKTGSNSYSGGVENFPRFLENWSGRTLRIRGSIVGLYESEVATEKWGSGDVYNPPKRNWGFHKKFGEGFYPPGTPTTRTFRGRDYQDLSESEYNTAMAQIITNLTSI